MDPVERQIRELHEKTEYTRLQFLAAELNSCLVALDMAKFELSVGNKEVARREIEFVEQGIRVMEQLLSEIRGEQKDEIRRKVSNIKVALHAVRLEARFF